MCIGDWRLGRTITSVASSILIPFGTSIHIPPSKQRVGIIFGVWADAQDAVGDCHISIDGVQWYTPGIAGNRTQFTLEHDGDISTRMFDISNLNANTDHTLGVVQLFLPESVIQSALESYQREYGKW